ncbi:unnamed protein product [Aphis gossypii]|uniref:Uncharacterized protein n=1 Tax=Aphis gossypii TaxID=80765 RepID=A0A9P0J2F5_APHGO|nr:unnamed protein product [Aphis gossypii]
MADMSIRHIGHSSARRICREMVTISSGSDVYPEIETTTTEDDDADADPSAAVFEFDAITSAVVDLGVIDEVSTSIASVEVKVVIITRYVVTYKAATRHNLKN